MGKITQLGLTIIGIAVIVYLVYIFMIDPPAGPMLRISPADAKSRRFGLIIDVRTPRERELHGYYPNSIPISLQTLQQEVPLDISNKNTRILVYCNTGNRAAQAANTLYNMGYRNVRYIAEPYTSLMPPGTF
jgi:rhodanese-related sulfurtransferase